jgi:hypothetical protein
MKTRQGFVSNSSSSSFVVTTPEHLDKKELTQYLTKVFAVPETSLLYDLSQDMAKCLAQESTYFETIDDYMDEEGYNRESDVDDGIRKAFKAGRAVYVGSAASDSGNTAETVICEMEIHYNTEELTVDKEAEY